MPTVMCHTKPSVRRSFRGHRGIVDRPYLLRGREIPYWFRRATKAVRPMPSSRAAAVWLPAVFSNTSRIRRFSSGSSAEPDWVDDKSEMRGLP